MLEREAAARIEYIAEFLASRQHEISPAACRSAAAALRRNLAVLMRLLPAEVAVSTEV